MRSLIFAGALAASVLTSIGTASAQECGNLSIANLNWQSAEVLANIDAFILEKGFGCKVELVTGETVPIITTMIERGSPNVVPEGWVNLLPDLVKKGLDEKKIRTLASPMPEGGRLGIWIPKYVADAHPEIKTIPDALKHPELFPAPEDPSKGGLLNSVAGSGAAPIVSQLFKAYKAADANFVLVDPGSAAAMDGSITRAYERKEGWLGFYWSPTALLGRYPMVKLEHGVPFDEAEWKRCTTIDTCPDPKPNDWPADPVVTLVSEEVYNRGGDALQYLNTRSWSHDTINKLLVWMTDNQASGESAAKHFLRENPDLWSKWVSPDVAEKVKAAL